MTIHTDGCAYLHHATWADNIYIVAAGRRQMEQMLEELTEAIGELGMTWKEGSTEVLWGT